MSLLLAVYALGVMYTTYALSQTFLEGVDDPDDDRTPETRATIRRWHLVFAFFLALFWPVYVLAAVWGSR